MSDLKLDEHGNLVATEMRWPRWDDPQPQPPFDWEEFRAAQLQLLKRPRPTLMPVRASFFRAWCRCWFAHRLSVALGYSSKEPPIR